MQTESAEYNIIKIIVISLCIALFMPLAASAELTVTSVSPNQGVAGQDFNITITGTGFDENTGVFMYSRQVLSAQLTHRG